ncbi:MAG: metallophosphoesterase [Sphingobacteriaceae bacterium]|nr:metallophosphoesterase [Sphingobacteriaceae bacterium]
MERRSALKNIGGLFLLPKLSKVSLPAEKKPVLRIAHLTDVHLKNQFNAPARFIKCLHHVQAQLSKVDLILNGGDIVFDMNKENIDTINEQWKLVNDVMKNECSIPVRYCLGNHDIWWNEDTKGDVFYGKNTPWINCNWLNLTTVWCRTAGKLLYWIALTWISIIPGISAN